MRLVFAFLLSIVLATMASAQNVLAIPAAVVEAPGSTAIGPSALVAAHIRAALIADLKQLNGVRILPTEKLRNIVFEEILKPKLDEWQAAGATALVHVLLRNNPDGTIMLGCWVFNTDRKVELRRTGLIALPKSWRNMARRCASLVADGLSIPVNWSELPDEPLPSSPPNDTDSTAKPSSQWAAAITTPSTASSTPTSDVGKSASCREVADVVTIAGKETRQKRTLCRNAQGKWDVASRPAPAVASVPPPAPTAPAVTPTAPRVALIVGNSAYDARFGSLANPVRDAAAMGAALRASGFDVEVVQDADQKAMKRALQRFGQRLAKAGRQATGLFFYAGHGVQSAGANYLVPINAAIENEGDVDLEAVAAESVLRQMEAAGISTSIVILDACRNMPLARAVRDGSRGLARMDAPNGSFIAYSTAPGQVAADGAGGNSPFTAALIAEIAKPGQEIQKTFLNVRRAVHQASGGKQVPWESSSLLDTFVFTPTP